MVDWNSFFQNWGFWIVLGIVIVGYAVYKIIQKVKSEKETNNENEPKKGFFKRKEKEEDIEEKFNLGKEHSKTEVFNETLSKKIQRINNDVKRIKEEQTKGLLEIKKLQKEIGDKVIVLKNKYVSLKEKEKMIKEIL